MTKYSLPDGSAPTIPLLQARRVWQVWLALAPVAAERGEGVSLCFEGQTGAPPPGWRGAIGIETVYAPQYEQVRIAVEMDGTAGWASEQDAPDVPVDFASPAPLGPWEAVRS